MTRIIAMGFQASIFVIFMCRHVQKVEEWIKIACKKQEKQLHPTGLSVSGCDGDNDSVPDDWEQQINIPPLSEKLKSSKVAPRKLKTPTVLPEPERYPNKLMIDRARVLVLATRYQFRKEKMVSMERSAHDYTGVRHSLIEQFGYEDTLEYILMNTIILEKLRFNNVTYERTKQVILDNGFDCEIPDIEHLKFFLETYRQLSNSLATKDFKDNLNRLCKDNDLPDILKDVYWTCKEMQLMLKLLVDDPRNEKDVNALIVFISMHGGLRGGKTVMYDCESKHIDVTQVLQKFEVPSIQNNENLCSLLFLSVCRGEKDNESEAVNVVVVGSGSEVVGKKSLENIGRADVNVEQGGRGDATSKGLEITGRAGVKVDQGGSGDTTSEGIENTGRAGVNVDQGGSGDMTSEGPDNAGRDGLNVDQRSSGNAASQRLENNGCAGIDVDQGDKEDTASEGLENNGSAEVNVKQRGRRDRSSEGRKNIDYTEVNTLNSQPSMAVAESKFQDGLTSVFEVGPLTQSLVEGYNDGSLSDRTNDNGRDFPDRSDDSNARIQAESLPVPIIGPAHSSPREEEVVQENMVTEHLLPETVGSCPNNCLVAYAATPGFKTGGYDHTGTLYIQEIVKNITKYESVALLPFLTLLHKDLDVHLEMPTFDHRLTKMPVLKKNEI